MAIHINVSIFLAAMLVSAEASDCDRGKCNVRDKTSLMQYQSAVTRGQSRGARSREVPAESNEEDLAELEDLDEYLEDGSAEKFTLEANPPLAPGCEDQG